MLSPFDFKSRPALYGCFVLLLAISLIVPVRHHHAFADNHHGITAAHNHDDLDESRNHENIEGGQACGGIHLHLTKVITNIFCSRFDLQTITKKTGTIKELAFIPEPLEDSRLFAVNHLLIRTKAVYYENLSGLSPPVA